MMMSIDLNERSLLMCHFLVPTVQLTLGGLRELEKRKNEVRIKHNLPPLGEDMYAVCETMRPASPPASAADLIEHQVPRRGIRAGKRVSFINSVFLQVWASCRCRQWTPCRSKLWRHDLHNWSNNWASG